MIIQLLSSLLLLLVCKQHQIYSEAASQSLMGSVNCKYYYSLLLYPRTITNIAIENLSPLKVKVTFHVPHLNETFSLSRMVCQRGFSITTAHALCSALGHTQANIINNMILDSNESCGFHYGNEVVNIPCLFSFESLSCTQNGTTKDPLLCNVASENSEFCDSNSLIGLNCYTPTTTSESTSTNIPSTTTTTTFSSSITEKEPEQTTGLIEDMHTTIEMADDSTTTTSSKEEITVIQNRKDSK